MKIVVDTTVFGQGFNSRSADVRLLKDFAERTHAEVCVPGVVYDEAINLVRKSVEEINAKLDVAQRLTGDDTAYSKLNIERRLSTYAESLTALFKDLNARVLPYPSVTHKKLATRALIPSKPFVTSGRGYRDALIWFSLLELTQDCGEEISFITGNSDDFCHSKKDLRLHGDLINDLKGMGIQDSRVAFFSSLGDFNQKCSIPTLPQPPKPTGETKRQPPNYQQLLLDGKEMVETLIGRALPEFLVGISRVRSAVEDVELIAMTPPTDIRDLPIRVMNSGRLVLQFSAEYKLAVEFSIQPSDLAAWSQRFSFHQRRALDEGHLRVMATILARVSFLMIERGEETESFSIASMSQADEYKTAFRGTDPVAVRLAQFRVHAPAHTSSWGVTSCASCGQQFGVGCNPIFPGQFTREKCVAKLEEILAEDHRTDRLHANLYDLAGPDRID